MTENREKSTRRFPCLEQPMKCYLSSAPQVRLSACRNGKLVFRSKRTPHEEFLVIPCQKNGQVMLKTTKWERFLCVQTPEDGPETVMVSELPTISPDADQEQRQHAVAKYQWQLIKGPGGTFLIVASANGMHLTATAENTATLSDTASTSWSLETLSGELLYLSFPHLDRRLRCDVFGMLAMSENWKGWEVWRLVDDDDATGNFRIISWMHNRYLCTDETGKVSTVADPTHN